MTMDHISHPSPLLVSCPLPFISKVPSPGAEKKMRLIANVRVGEGASETPTERRRGERKHSSPVGRGARFN